MAPINNGNGAGEKRWAVVRDSIKPPNDPAAYGLLDDLLMRCPTLTVQELRVRFWRDWREIEALHRGG